MAVQWREKQVRDRSSLTSDCLCFRLSVLLEGRRWEIRITKTGAADGLNDQ